MQIFVFCADPALPRTVIMNPYTYYTSGGVFFSTIGGSLFGAN